MNSVKLVVSLTFAIFWTFWPTKLIRESWQFCASNVDYLGNNRNVTDHFKPARDFPSVSTSTDINHDSGQYNRHHDDHHVETIVHSYKICKIGSWVLSLLAEDTKQRSMTIYELPISVRRCKEMCMEMKMNPKVGWVGVVGSRCGRR